MIMLGIISADSRNIKIELQLNSELRLDFFTIQFDFLR